MSELRVIFDGDDRLKMLEDDEGRQVRVEEVGWWSRSVLEDGTRFLIINDNYRQRRDGGPGLVCQTCWAVVDEASPARKAHGDWHAK